MDNLEEKLVQLLERVDKTVSDNVPQLTQEYISYITSLAGIKITIIFIVLTLLWTLFVSLCVFSFFYIKKGTSVLQDLLLPPPVLVMLVMAFCFFSITITVGFMTELPELYARYNEPIGYAVDKVLNEK